MNVPIVVKSRHSLANIEKKREKLKTKNLPDPFEGAVFIDVTSRGPDPWVKFSPFYPHDEIPVPFTESRRAASVEGVWQALKVFENADVDPSVLENRTMKKLKRTVRKYGRCLGHRKGLDGEELLGYLEARRLIYLPTYRWVLENALTDEVAKLREILDSGVSKLILLDYETNCSVENLSKPLSHAGLISAHLQGNYPK